MITRAPDTTDNQLAWIEQAACRGEDPETFFAETGVRVIRAKWFCDQCPVKTDCLALAMGSEDTGRYGIFGGLTATERTLLAAREPRTGRKKAPCGTPSAYSRHVKNKEPIDDACRAAKRKADRDARASGRTYWRQPRVERTLQEIFEEGAAEITAGHLGWTGPARPCHGNRQYLPKQIAFVLDRGREPVGQIKVTCEVSDCILPAHLADNDERMRCGTNAGYRRHLKEGTPTCEACKRAHAQADRRLHTTGSSL